MAGLASASVRCYAQGKERGVPLLKVLSLAQGGAMSDEGTYRHLLVERRRSVVWVTLNRPEVRNAFNAELIADLQRCFATLGADDRVRAIVLAGAGPLFSA